MLKSAAKVQTRGIPPRWIRFKDFIEAAGPKLQTLNDAALRKASLALRYRASGGEPLDSLLVEAFALVREAATRRINMRHYPVQLLGGIAMHFGSIAVMSTGEGKTLTATLPTYLAALQGRGAHLATANDYLAERDARLMGPVYEALGLTVGTVLADSSRTERHRAYGCDITYTTAKEIGFDFLRDRLWQRRQASDDPSVLAAMLGQTDLSSEIQTVQRTKHFLLLDEADNILIDEARTPLIVSAVPNRVARIESELYRWATRHSDKFDEKSHYRIDEATRLPNLNEQGRRMVREIELPEMIGATPLPDLYDHVQQSIHVNRTYFRDRHYVIRDHKIVIVDEFTGRLAEGRQWRSGLHQAIEAREGLDVSVTTGEAARVTIQDLCLQYQRICGMTGTVATSARELRKIYKLRSVNVPTNRAPRREQWPDMVLGTEAHKWNAIVDEIKTINATGRPILIGTRSIDKSERLASQLTAAGIAHIVLNARHLANEAEIVAQAGKQNQVTVATNMAGRGTDIQLDEKSVRLGGLHVICTELHDAARIDRQLIGRCGRQGDPGSFRQFMCLDDDILQNAYGAAKANRLKRFANESTRQLARFGRHFYFAQQRVERQHFQSRKVLLYRERQRQILQREMGQDPYLDTPSQ